MAGGRRWVSAPWRPAQATWADGRRSSALCLPTMPKGETRDEALPHCDAGLSCAPRFGRNAPPPAPRSLRDVTPLPTWVELEFVPLAGNQLRTRVQLTHYGFKDGELWEESYRWFARAWAGVLGQMEKQCANGK